MITCQLRLAVNRAGQLAQGGKKMVFLGFVIFINVLPYVLSRAFGEQDIGLIPNTATGKLRVSLSRISDPRFNTTYSKIKELQK